MSQAPSSRTTRDDGLLCCDVGVERYAFRGRDVRHVERAEYLRADPGGDGRVGTLALGARHVPVHALGDVLGRPAAARPPAAPDAHIAVTGDRHAMVGWLVDRIARAPQPAAGDVAPLPPLVGARATSWFEGIVMLSGDASMLLLAPDRLTSAPPDSGGDTGIVFEPPQPVAAGEPEPVAVVFSTSVFPATAVRRYALSGRQIAAVVQPTAPIPVPGCSDFILGVTWWRGAVVPVVDFRDSADRAGAHPRRLIVQCGPRRHGSLVAFSIDSEVFMCRPAEDHLRVPAVSCPAFASGVFDINGEAVALLDLDALLAGPPHAAPA